MTGNHGEDLRGRVVVGRSAWAFVLLLRIPMIVRRPGGHNGGPRNQAPTSILDMIGIIAEETSIPRSSDVDSRPIGEHEIVVAEERVSALFRKQKHLDRDLARVEQPWGPQLLGGG